MGDKDVSALCFREGRSDGRSPECPCLIANAGQLNNVRYFLDKN